MTDIPMYHEGSRALQDRYATRRLADRLGEVVAHTAFTDKDREFIESRPMFFLATADAEGRPDCSYKGGRPGFVRTHPRTAAPSVNPWEKRRAAAAATCGVAMLVPSRPQ